jgi:hypothetical protein
LLCTHHAETSPLLSAEPYFEQHEGIGITIQQPSLPGTQHRRFRGKAVHPCTVHTLRQLARLATPLIQKDNLQPTGDRMSGSQRPQTVYCLRLYRGEGLSDAPGCTFSCAPGVSWHDTPPALPPVSGTASAALWPARSPSSPYSTEHMHSQMRWCSAGDIAQWTTSVIIQERLLHNTVGTNPQLTSSASWRPPSSRSSPGCPSACAVIAASPELCRMQVMATMGS